MGSRRARANAESRYALAMLGVLMTSLAPLREPKVQRGVIDRRLARFGAQALLASFEKVFRDVRDGGPTARASALVVGSWLVHQRGNLGTPGVRTAFEALSKAAVASAFPLTSALLRDGPASAALARGGAPRGDLHPRQRTRFGACLPYVRFRDLRPEDRDFRPEDRAPRGSCRAKRLRRDASHRGIRAARAAPFPPLGIDATRYFFGVGTTPLLHPLRNHHDPKVVARLLDQRWLRLRDAVTIAARRPTLPEMAWTLATRDRWFLQPAIREALAQNPYTPTGLVLAMIPILPTATVRRLERFGSPEVRTAVDLHRGRA